MMNLYEVENVFFKFEEDFVEASVRCIPMIVRYKLDACGIKLKLAEWSRMNVEERNHLAVSPCESKIEIKAYRTMVHEIVQNRCHHEATSLEIDYEPMWAQLNRVPQQLLEKTHEF